MKEIELFAFDLDGTLLDTAPDFLYAVNVLRERYNLEEADSDHDQNQPLQDYIFPSIHSLHIESLELYQEEFHLDQKQIVQFLSNYFLFCVNHIVDLNIFTKPIIISYRDN